MRAIGSGCLRQNKQQQGSYRRNGGNPLRERRELNHEHLSCAAESSYVFAHSDRIGEKASSNLISVAIPTT
jgi:hypothetical protein